jgi:hypothetical protein
MIPFSHEEDRRRVEVQAKHREMTLLGNAQALVLANLALAVARCAGFRPEVIADLMEGQTMRHDDPMAATLATGMQRAALTTLRGSMMPAGHA